MADRGCLAPSFMERLRGRASSPAEKRQQISELERKVPIFDDASCAKGNDSTS